jgi:hypothetical protein
MWTLLKIEPIPDHSLVMILTELYQPMLGKCSVHILFVITERERLGSMLAPAKVPSFILGNAQVEMWQGTK